MLVSGTIADSEGQHSIYYSEFDSPATNRGIAEGMNGDSHFSTFASLRYGDLTLEGLVGQREKADPTGAWGTDFNDPRMRLVDTRGMATLRYDHDFEEEWRVTGRASFDESKVVGDYPYGALSRDSGTARWVGLESTVTRHFVDKHTVVLGAEYRNYLSHDQSSYLIGDAPVLDDRRSSSTWAVFGEGEVMLHPDVVLNAGVRYDHYEVFGGAANPRVGLIWSALEATTIKGLYGTAFRAPNAYELYYIDGFQTAKNNAGLNAERIDTYELIWEQQLLAHLRLSVSGYYYEIGDLISQIIDPSDGLAVFRNVDEIRAFGVEVGLEGRTEWGLRSRASYAVQRSEDAGTGIEFSREFPAHLAKLGVQAPLFRERVFGGLEVQYSSSATALSGREIDDFLITNLTIFARDVLKGLDASALVYNLFDVRYAYSGGPQHIQDGITQDGINFRLKLTYRF